MSAKDFKRESLVEQGEEHIDGKVQNNAPFIAEENEILSNVPSVTTEDWNGILRGLGFDISLTQLAEESDYLQQALRVIENVVEDNLVEAEEEICILSIQELCDVLEAVALGSDNVTEKELIQLLKVTEKLRKASEKVGAAEEAKVFVGRAEDNGPHVLQIPTQKWNEDFEWSDSNSSNIADEDLAQSADKGEKFEQSSEMAQMLKRSGEDTRNLVNEEPAPSEKSKGNSKNEEVAQSVQECDELKQALEAIKEVNVEENFERKGGKETQNRTFSSIYDKKNRPKKLVQNTCKKRKKDDHKCNETMCTLCKKCVDIENHLCFVPQPPTKKKIENARNDNANALKDITQHMT